MTNQEILIKMDEDMKMMGFSHCTEESYRGKAKDVMRYFNKPMEEVTTEELREFLLKYLREERKISERSVNYYNSVIRFMYEVTMDKIINKKQLPMYKKRIKMKDVLTKEELSAFFNACDNYMYKTIFMLIYGSGLRISEAVNLKIKDIDSRNGIVDVYDEVNKDKTYKGLSVKSTSNGRITTSLNTSVNGLINPMLIMLNIPKDFDYANEKTLKFELYSGNSFSAENRAEGWIQYGQHADYNNNFWRNGIFCICAFPDGMIKSKGASFDIENVTGVGIHIYHENLPMNVEIMKIEFVEPLKKGGLLQLLIILIPVCQKCVIIPMKKG